MEKKSADVETVTGASGILSVSQSFGSFGRDYKSIIPARDARSVSWDRPNLSNPKIPGLLRRVLKGGSDRKSRHQEVGEWSLEECRHSIMELAKEMNRVMKNSAIPTPVSSEDTCSLEECRCFIMKWADELDKLVQNSVSAGEAVEQGLAELVKEWKRGKLSNILPIMEFIMWTLIKEEADKGIVTRMWFFRMLKSQNIGAGRCIPDSVWQWIHKASVDVTLDPDTAYPWLILSAEGKRVRKRETWQDLPDNPKRFDYWECVLGREGFTSGRRYWQVQVGGNTNWRLGVSRESAKRKGWFSTTPQLGYWTVEWCRYRDEFTALTDPQTPLPRSLEPQKLGVYLDYEEGQLFFYNVETRSHIYTFTDMEFNPSEKLYPFFYTYSVTDLVLESPDPVSAAD
ncbi:butyrophilin subfamily 1 member A1-like isoform X3 [Acipenser ruthenus]|uniref:butyrophilin subfamily 1 member A1-like isoform X3 n=1 Tax=Acipenser ruthenus TaxID=7906 RepID=UPI0027421062|nr:butyrophilin subfamily 1 member A1-like isoform X3 [Acipenser ruthenus]